MFTYRFTIVLLILLATLISGCATNLLPASSSQPGSTDAGRTQGNYRDVSTIGSLDDIDRAPDSHSLADPSAGGSLTLDRQSAADQARRNAGTVAASAGGQAPTKAPGASQPSAQTSGLVLGQGDEIEFRMSGQPDMTTTSYVSSQGTISLPLLGRINVGGQSPSEAETTVAGAYQDGGYFNRPQVNITITQYRSSQVSVLGAVNKPGRYPLETRTSVLDALAQAGGVSNAGSSNVIVIRNTSRGTKRYRLPIKALVSGADREGRFNLTTGDTLFVPEAPLFYIYGEVQRPNAYPLQPGMTVMQAISTGGGLTQRGSSSRVVITREGDGSIRELDPELTDRVKPGDVIFVKERFF